MNPTELLTTLFDLSGTMPTLEDYAGPRIRTRAGQTLYDAHDPVTDIYVLLAGRVVLTTVDDPPRPLLQLRGPAITGDIEVVAEQSQHLHSAVCLDPCDIAIVPGSGVTELATSAVASAWHRDIARRHQRSLATHIAETHPLEDRLARWLSDSFAADLFTLPGDRELAAHLQVSEDRAGRARRALEKSGRLSGEGDARRIELKGPLAGLMPGQPLIHSVGR